jgi:hypothetical protein
MAPFPPWSNSVLSAVLAILAAGMVLVVVLAWAYVRSPYNTDVGEAVAQPLPFDNRHHASDDGIDCRYCHFIVERSANAGVPPTSLCMNCHAQIWSGGDLLEPVRRATYENETLVWNRVTSVPDFVFFNHSIHVGRGVGCVSCHGRVDLMAAVYKVERMNMAWCLDCHRDPTPHLRPADAITDMTWTTEAPRAVGERIARELNIRPPEHCSGCHR